MRDESPHFHLHTFISAPRTIPSSLQATRQVSAGGLSDMRTRSELEDHTLLEVIFIPTNISITNQSKILFARDGTTEKSGDYAS